MTPAADVSVSDSPPSGRGIYWLASYPKSGNTWVRVILTNYLRDAEAPASINELDGGPIASGRAAFDENVGISASDLTPDEIDRYRPRVYEEMVRRVDAPLYLKVHDANTYNRQGNPLFPAVATAGVLYLIRNPLDVAPSWARHAGRTMADAARAMGDPEFDLLSKTDRLHDQLRQRILNWSGHVKSWVDTPPGPLLVVRYEDLRADTRSAVVQLVGFLGLEVDPRRVDKAVAFSDFKVLRAQERDHGFRERLQASPSFFREGTVGSWRAHLPAHLVERLMLDHGEVMRRFGYLTESGEPAY